jgi:hypothetical protein
MLIHITILALTTGIAPLLASASFANDVSTITQTVNQESTIVGNGNVVKIDTHQSSIDLRTSDRHFTSTGNYQKINARTTIVGDRNIDMKTVFQGNVNSRTNK